MRAVTYRFEDFEVDLAGYELRRGGQPVHVEPQVFEVLAFLLANHGRLVSKDELLDGVWRTRFVSESALTSRLKTLRRALGDDGDAQRVIRTVRGRGYQFVAAVVADEADLREPAERRAEADKVDQPALRPNADRQKTRTPA